MTKQKSMGKIAHDVFYRGDYFWCELIRESVWHKVAKAVIAEHERRKRAKRKVKKHPGIVVGYNFKRDKTNGSN